MAFTPPYDVDPSPTGDTVREGVSKNEGNISDVYDNLNTLLAMIEAVPVTGEEILAALAPVDGINSGLDAELLGGRLWSEYGLANHTHGTATHQSPGFLAAIDKQKLDSLNQGAEPNVQSDWTQTNSSHDAFIRNKPKMVGTTGLIESGDIGVFHDAVTLEGKNPDEMKNYLDYFETGDFLETSAGAADAGKPVVLDSTGLIHASMIPAVPAEAIWGGITGTLANQTDLQDELDLKSNTDHNHDTVYEPVLGNPANDGEVLSSMTDGRRSWIPMAGIGQVDWGDIGGTLSAQTDLQAELDARYQKTEHIAVSAGAGDAGKPIVLGSNGQIDPSMMDVSVFYYVGSFTPVAGTEYPSTSGESHGAFWVVQGVDDTNGYTFAGGDLSGLTIHNGDFMVWAAAGWSIMAGEMNPMLYYKLDGSQPLTNHFQAGGFMIRNIGTPVADDDAISKVWADLNLLSLAGGTMTGKLTIEQKGAVINLTNTETHFFAGVAADGSNGWYFGRGRLNSNDFTIGNYYGSTIELPDGGGATLDGAQIYTDDYHPGASSPEWGDIGGTLSNQDDLQAALDAKAAASHDHTMADISDLVFPVDSVNGKTGAVTINSADVGALPANGKAMDSALLNGSADYLPTSGGTIFGHLQVDNAAIDNATFRLYNAAGKSPRIEAYIDANRRGGLFFTDSSVILAAYDSAGAAYADIKLNDDTDSVDITAVGGLNVNSTGTNSAKLSFTKNGVARFEILRQDDGTIVFASNDASGTWLSNPIEIHPDPNDHLFIPKLAGNTDGWTINGDQIYTDAYHPAIADLLTEIATLKQRITALEEA
jgi:hypothetical protein